MTIAAVSITPIGEGVSVSRFVAAAQEVLRGQDRLDYRLDPMFTTLEGDLDEVNLIDVREQNEWDAARIEAFTLRPLSTMQQWSPRLLDDFDPAKPTYVICAAGVRSARAAAALTDLGFDDVRNVSGGMYAYGGPNLVTGK